MTNPITALFKAPWPDRDKERLQSMQSTNAAIAATTAAIAANNKRLAATASRLESTAAAIAANNKRLAATASELTAAVDRMELALLRLKEKRQKAKKLKSQQPIQ